MKTMSMQMRRFIEKDTCSAMRMHVIRAKLYTRPFPIVKLFRELRGVSSSFVVEVSEIEHTEIIAIEDAIKY